MNRPTTWIGTLRVTADVEGDFGADAGVKPHRLTFTLRDTSWVVKGPEIELLIKAIDVPGERQATAGGAWFEADLDGLTIRSAPRDATAPDPLATPAADVGEALCLDIGEAVRLRSWLAMWFPVPVGDATPMNGDEIREHNAKAEAAVDLIAAQAVRKRKIEELLEGGADANDPEVQRLTLEYVTAGGGVAGAQGLVDNTAEFGEFSLDEEATLTRPGMVRITPTLSAERREKRDPRHNALCLVSVPRANTVHYNPFTVAGAQQLARALEGEAGFPPFARGKWAADYTFILTDLGGHETRLALADTRRLATLIHEWFPEQAADEVRPSCGGGSGGGGVCCVVRPARADEAQFIDWRARAIKAERALDVAEHDLRTAHFRIERLIDSVKSLSEFVKAVGETPEAKPL